MVGATVVVAAVLVGLLVYVLSGGPADETVAPAPAAESASDDGADGERDGQVGAPVAGPAGPSATPDDGAAGAPAGDDDAVRNVEDDDPSGEASSQPAPDGGQDGASSVTLDDGSEAVDVPANGEAGAEQPPVTTLNGPADDDDDDGERPSVAPPGDRSTPAGEGVVLAIRATHDDELGYAAEGLPPGLAIDTGTGVITGSPTETGTWEVAVTVTADDGGAATQRFTWAVTAPVQSSDCSREGQVRSRSSSAAISFEVVNQTGDTVDVHWLNHSGNRVRFHTLAPAETVVIDSFATNPWLVADADTGTCLRLEVDPVDGDRIVVQ